MTVTVEGATRLRRTMRRAGVDLKQLKETHRKVATFVQSSSRSSAPFRTGRLVKSGRTGATQTAAVVRYGYAARTPYAPPIHWGWPKRGIRAQPWVTTTAQRTEPTWVGMYMKTVDQLLDRIQGI